MSEYTSFDNKTDVLLHASSEHVLTYAEFEAQRQQAELRAQHETQPGQQSTPEIASATPLDLISQATKNVWRVRQAHLEETKDMFDLAA